jgi:hypothetical protein
LPGAAAFTCDIAARSANAAAEADSPETRNSRRFIDCKMQPPFQEQPPGDEAPFNFAVCTARLNSLLKILPAKDGFRG